MPVATPAIEGQGLITGLPVRAWLEPAEPGSGIVFVSEGVRFVATPHAIAQADRGVTLYAEGKTLSLVEHFLSACSILNQTNVCLHVEGAPELPIGDGSAQPWVDFLSAHGLGPKPVSGVYQVAMPVHHMDPKDSTIFLAAFPSDTLTITYMVDFPHPELTRRWVTWTEYTGDLLIDIAPARTFGFLSELPTLQARGLAQGVTLENTVGLTETGGYTVPLRFPDEPIRHKILDLIGDLMLCGIPIGELKAHIVVCGAGHQSHLVFGQRLAQQLVYQSLS